MSKNSKQSPRSSKDDPDYVLAYSTDPIPKKQSAEKITSGEALNPIVSFERKGRGGKSVTLLSRLPAREDFLKELCAFLKRSVGSGGTYYVKDAEGIIEIQGEWREQLVALVKNYKQK